MSFTGIFHININCSDLEKSREFYELLGFKVEWDMRDHPNDAGTAMIQEALRRCSFLADKSHTRRLNRKTEQHK